MRISHEAIYQSLFIQGRGALKRELLACLRSDGRCAYPVNVLATVANPFSGMH
ncbi:Transposase, IS30 family [Agrobacterium sp. DSM 25558]|uniref:Transposase, IS30 family n=1 Tax=Agrobacterium rosae TaxID=1972867 RepID=A0A1R3U7L0_9HYPH|nr:Transposase, IS30 family [Agrobacterium sp. DSM 25558]SCX35662.1 Transposase, IS30 family [Agrobacterium rosae]